MNVFTKQRCVCKTSNCWLLIKKKVNARKKIDWQIDCRQLQHLLKQLMSEMHVYLNFDIQRN